MGFEEDDDFDEINEANARMVDDMDDDQKSGSGMTPEQIQQYQMQLIMQQQMAMKSGGEGFNALRVRKQAQPAPVDYDDENSSQDEYGEEEEQAIDLQAEKKKFAEQMKQALLAGKKKAPAKKEER